MVWSFWLIRPIFLKKRKKCFDEYLLAVQEEEAKPDPIEAELLAAGASLIYSLNLSDTITGDAPGEIFLSESAYISDARGEELMYQFFDPKDTDY